MSYFATARVTSIRKDETREGHYYAYVSDYLELDRAVPFRENSHYYESRLRRADGKTNKGAFGRSVRRLSNTEYELILRAGFSALLTDDDRLDDEMDAVRDYTPATVDRPLIQRVVTRPFREAAFSRQVKEAYDHTCAFTGFQIRNGGGRSEVQAAHIRPVKKQGPDSIKNGLALSGTVHWMFDRGLISLDEDYSMLIAENRIPDAISSMFNSDRQLHVPASRIQSPHPQFVRYHRDNVFLG